MSVFGEGIVKRAEEGGEDPSPSAQFDKLSDDDQYLRDDPCLLPVTLRSKGVLYIYE